MTRMCLEGAYRPFRCECSSHQAIQTVLVWAYTTPSHTDHAGVSVHHTKPHNRKFLSKYTAIMYTQCQCIDCTDVTIWLLPVLLLKTEASYPNCSIACYIQWVAWWYIIDFWSAPYKQWVSITYSIFRYTYLHVATAFLSEWWVCLSVYTVVCCGQLIKHSLKIVTILCNMLWWHYGIMQCKMSHVW